MSMNRRTAGATIATAAAAFFMSGVAMTTLSAPAEAAGVKCVGANSCKGHSDCQTASNACKGLNSCKGLGFITVDDDAACAAKGGKVAK